MDQSRDALIREAATRFRYAIEKCPPEKLGVTFERFPHGACGDTVPLLGTYLIEQGFGMFDYVLGERSGINDAGEPRSESHAWLVQDGLLVDITADQFPEVSDAVLVTRELPALHASFVRTVEHAADYRVYDARTVATLDHIYQRIVAALVGAGGSHTDSQTSAASLPTV